MQLRMLLAQPQLFRRQLSMRPHVPHKIRLSDSALLWRVLLKQSCKYSFRRRLRGEQSALFAARLAVNEKESDALVFESRLKSKLQDSKLRLQFERKEIDELTYRSSFAYRGIPLEEILEAIQAVEAVASLHE